MKNLFKIMFFKLKDNINLKVEYALISNEF